MYYQLRHKRDSVRITRPSYRSAVDIYARQWRDSDGGIPWDMYVIPSDPRDCERELQVNPWNGRPL